MQIEKFITQSNISVREFAKLCDISYSRMYRITYGAHPTIFEVELIRKATQGMVGFEDWLIRGQNSLPRKKSGI